MRKLLLVLCMLTMAVSALRAQDSAMLAGVPGRAFTVSGFAEVYYGYDFNRPGSNRRPDFVYTHNRHNEVNLNVAWLQGRYAADRVHATLALAAGTYMNAVYAAEPGGLRYVYEANVGVKLAAKHALWLDAGVLPSHIGFESAYAPACTTLTRSIMADNSPYYESGVRLFYRSVRERWYLAALMLNGWQRIQRADGNSAICAGTQVMWMPREGMVFNYSTFFGNDRPDSARKYRIFHNAYATVPVGRKLAFTAGLDYGIEERGHSAAGWSAWQAATLVVQYKLLPRMAVAVRGEYYEDPDGVIIKPGKAGGFRTAGYSAGVDIYLPGQVLWRTEAKLYVSQTAIYTDPKGNATPFSPGAATSLCVSF